METKIPVTWIVLIALMSSITLGVLLEEPKIDESKFVFGSAHEHASMSILIFGDEVDLTGSQFQVESYFIHLENKNGYVIHRHSTDVTLGYFFKTLNLGLSKDCFVLIDDEKKYCTNNDYSLKFYINEKKVDDLRDYIVFSGDYILISYGAESPEEIAEQLAELRDRGFPFKVRERNDDNLTKV